jgi:molybdopterin synthase catalytic subunit
VPAEHRAEAFEACRYVVDATNESDPMWKLERSPGDRKAWIPYVNLKR